MTERERLIEVLSNIDYACDNGSNLQDRIEFIADYLLANGVIVPPCKVGDTVYTYGLRRVKEWKITFCGKNSSGEHKMIAADDDFKNILEFWNYDIGKTVFLTKEEAEQALEDMKNDNEK